MLQRHTLQGILHAGLQQVWDIPSFSQQLATPLSRPLQLRIQLQPDLLRIKALQQQLRSLLSSPSNSMQCLHQHELGLAQAQ